MVEGEEGEVEVDGESWKDKGGVVTRLSQQEEKGERQGRVMQREQRVAV